MDTCKSTGLELILDKRLGNITKYTLVNSGGKLMQVPDEVRKCVLFLSYKTATQMEYAGTAFLVGVPLNNDYVTVYIVTAKHVIDCIKEKSIDQKVYLRVNIKEGGLNYVESEIEQWVFHPSDESVDVAILNWTPPEEIIDYRVIDVNNAATQEIIDKEKIGVGEEVFLTGLFASHSGTQKNVPIMRAGNIAAMPEEKISVKKFGNIDAYLIEVRSIGGLSGSPVFVYLGSWRSQNGSMTLGGHSSFYWLGLMHGHYDKDMLDMDSLSEDMLRNLRINMGIAIVVPVWKILEVINQEKFIEQREKLSNDIKLRELPSPD